MHHDADLALYIAGLVGIGALCQWAAWRLRLPAILPLLIVGLLLGPVTGLLEPDRVLGDLLFPLVSLGVAIILFEGALTLRLSEVRHVGRVIRNLTSIGVLITWGIMGLAAHHLADLSWPLAMLFGAIVTVTGPTVIVPMLRSIRPTQRVANVLRWEGILIDPIGAALAVLVFEFILTGAESKSLLQFGKVVTLGAVWGVAGGAVLALILRRQWLPDFLINYFSLAFVLVIFSASNTLGEESGLIAVTVMGMVLANTRGLDVDDLVSFKEDLTLLLISMLFIVLAARLDFDQLSGMLVPSLLILAVALFVARPIAVIVSSIGTSMRWREKALVSWVAPRGIVAAAVSALFALRLESAGDVAAGLLVPLTFVVIIGTVVLQSVTAGWLAVRLGLSSRDEQGALIVGSNRVALALGEALKEQGLKVKLVDTHRQGLHEARMRGLDTFFGNPLSEHAERYMDLTGFTHLLAMSRHAEFNAVVCAQYRHQFGTRRVYMVQTGAAEDAESRRGLTPSLRFNPLFPADITWKRLSGELAQGAEIKATELTEQFDQEAFRATWGNEAIPLFAVDPAGKLRVRQPDQALEPGPGWTLVNLVPAQVIEQIKKEQAAESQRSAAADNGDADPVSG